MSKIKEAAYKELVRLKLNQLNTARDTFPFSHPIAFETIWLFSHKFDEMYKDRKMLSILHYAYEEFQTDESNKKLVEGLNNWMAEKGYTYEQVFK